MFMFCVYSLTLHTLSGPFFFLDVNGMTFPLFLSFHSFATGARSRDSRGPGRGNERSPCQRPCGCLRTDAPLDSDVSGRRAAALAGASPEAAAYPARE